MLRIVFGLLFLLSTHCHSQVLWQHSTSGLVTAQPVVFNKHVYLVADKQLQVLDKKGSLIWQYQFNEQSFSTPLITSKQIIIQTVKGLYSLSHQGNVNWFYESIDEEYKVNGKSWGWKGESVVEPWAWYRSSPIEVDDMIVFGTSRGTFAVNNKNGVLKWQTNTGITHTTPSEYEGIIVVGSWDNHLYGLDSKSGKTIWTFESRLPQGAMGSWEGWKGFDLSPTISEGIVYVGGRGSFFYAVEAKTGIERWSSQYASTWIGTTALVSDGNVYFGLSDGFSLVGLNAKRGTQSLLHLNDFYSFAQPQANREYIFYATLSGKIYAVNKNNWQAITIFNTNESEKNYQDLVSPKGGLKYSSADVYTHDVAVSDVKNMHNKLGSILSLALVDNVLYAGTANGKVYAVNVANL